MSRARKGRAQIRSKPQTAGRGEDAGDGPCSSAQSGKEHGKEAARRVPRVRHEHHARQGGGGGDGSGELMEGNGAVLLCGCRHPTPHTTTKRRERGIVLRQQLLATEYARDITGSERARRPANNARREREGVGEHRLSARTTTRDGSARNARSGSEKRQTIARA